MGGCSPGYVRTMDLALMCHLPLLYYCATWCVAHTGGPPLTRKSLTRFPLPRFLAYVPVSGGLSVSRGPQYSPTNTSLM